MRWFVAGGAILLPIPGPAWAASCSASATGLAFGTYIPSTPTAATSTGTITVNCSNLGPKTVSYTIALNAGLNGGGVFTNRRMANGAARLSYQIYRDAARSQIWGDGTGGTTVVSAKCTITLTTCSSSNTVYGSIPASQSPTPGSYTDTITATVTY